MHRLAKRDYLAHLYRRGNHGAAAAELMNLAIHLLMEDRPVHARELLYAARGLFTSAEQPFQAARCDADIGWVEMRLGHTRKAEASLHRALRRFRAMGNEGAVAICHQRLGDLALQRARPVEALAMFESALAHLAPARDLPLIADECRVGAADALEQLSRPQEAIAYLQLARDSFRERSEVGRVAECDEALGRLFAATGNDDEAVAAAASAVSLYDALGDDAGMSRAVELLEDVGGGDASDSRSDPIVFELDQMKYS